jgi:ankyrin repeat protein
MVDRIVTAALLLVAGTAIAADANTGLLNAIERRDATEAIALLNQGADPNGATQEKSGTFTPLMLAVYTNQRDVAIALLEHGADPNVSLSDEKPVNRAAIADVEILKALLGFGANPNAKTGLRYTALSSVAGCWPGIIVKMKTEGKYFGELPNCDEALEVLLKAGAKVNEPGFHGETPIFDAADRLNQAFVRRLLEAGADPNWVGEIKQSPLAQVFQRYIDTSKKIDKIPEDPRTAAQLAKDTRAIIDILLEYGASPDFRYEGEYYGYEEVRRGGYVDGYTLLGLAARNGWFDTAAVLLAHGANPVLARSDGLLPADIADRHGHSRTAALIRSHASALSANSSLQRDREP